MAAPLRSFLTNDARFSVPAPWADRSITILTAPAPGRAANGNGATNGNGAGGGEGGGDGGAGFSVTLHRDALAPGEDLAAYVERQLDQLRDALAGFTPLRRGERVVGGEAGHEVEFIAVGPQGRVRQHQVFVARGGRVLTWTASAAVPQYPNYAGEFAALIASVRFVAPAFAETRGESSAEQG